VTPSGSSKLEELPGCVNGRPRIEDGQGGWMACKPDPAYRANFPTTPAGARKELYHNDFVGSDHHDDAGAFEKAGDLLMERRLPPAARAAVFVALATISGTTVVPDAVTATGAVGVAVARVDAGRTTRDELIFDPVAHTLIGRRSILLPGGSRPMVQPPGMKATVQTTREGSQVMGSSQGAPGGTQEDSSRPGTVRSEVVLYSTGVLESAIVSRVGLRPDGTVRAGVIEPAFTK
jgi:hypothetical protein